MVMDGMKSATLLVLSNAVYAGVNVFYKLAVIDGMSARILVAYRFMFASAFMAPLAFFLERRTRPRMTWRIAFQGVLCGLFGGALGQNLYIGSLVLTSTTFVAAMANLIPAVTFILAVLFRLERLAIGSKEGTAKVMGTILGISGAMVLTFYKGVEMNLWSTNINLIKHNKISNTPQGDYPNRSLGAFLAVASCISYSIWLIIQAKLSRSYPCHYSSTALMCISAAVQSTIYAMLVEKDWSAWKLDWNIRLLSAAYAGLLASGVVVALLAQCLHKKGPLFVTIFNPLMLIFVAIFGSLFLEEKLHLGGLLGSVLIVLGLYAVLWGKGIEMKKMSLEQPKEALPVQERG